MPSDLLVLFLRGVRKEDVRIRLPRLIFLCGGRLGRQAEASPSGRDFFLRQVNADHHKLAFRLSLSERICRGADAIGFTNFFEVETLVAQAVGAILVFVESPGSYTELGAFTALDLIRPKVIAVLEDKHRSDKKSFIFLGPIKKLISENVNSVVWASWLKNDAKDTAVDATDARRMVVKVTDHVMNFLRDSHTTKLLFTRHSSELTDESAMALVTGLLNVFGVMTVSDIERALEDFFPQISSTKIDQYLFVLQRLNIVEQIRYSKQTFYCCGQSLVEWSFTPEASHANIDEWKVYLRSQYSQQARYRKYLGALKKSLSHGKVKKGESWAD